MVLDDANKEAVKKILSEMTEEITLHLFTGNCEACDIEEELVTEVAELGKIKVEKHNLDSEKAKELGVENIPALVFDKMPNVRFIGLPSGHEFRTFLDTIISVSKGNSELKDEIKTEAKNINGKVDIKVFITPTCPYCPMAVFTAHKFAMENSNIHSEMIEATEFPEMSQKYGVMAVPKIVINDKVSFEGAVPEHIFLQKIKEAL